MDEILGLMLANPGLSVRLDIFRPSNSLRLKFSADQAAKEAFIYIPSLKENSGLIAEEAISMAQRMKLKLSKRIEADAGTPLDMR